jgi:hypothetical protein
MLAIVIILEELIPTSAENPDGPISCAKYSPEQSMLNGSNWQRMLSQYTNKL